MGEPAKDEFDAKCFLSKVGAGKTILEFHKNQHVFEQGDVSDTVFYIQKGKVKLTVLSKERAPNYGELPLPKRPDDIVHRRKANLANVDHALPSRRGSHVTFQ
jgi:hypothetical protein